MKTALKLFTLTAVAVVLASCGGKKADEALMKDVTAFEEDWTVTMTGLNEWIATVETSCNGIKANHATFMEDQATKDAQAKMNDAQKEQWEDLKAKCMDSEGQCFAYASSAKTLAETMTAATTAFTEWKAQVEKVEVSTEEATAKLAELKSGLDANKVSINEWRTAYDQTTAAHADNEKATMDLLNTVKGS